MDNKRDRDSVLMYGNKKYGNFKHRKQKLISDVKIITRDTLCVAVCHTRTLHLYLIMGNLAKLHFTFNLFKHINIVLWFPR